jgi:hypothetical protein
MNKENMENKTEFQKNMAIASSLGMTVWGQRLGKVWQQAVKNYEMKKREGIEPGPLSVCDLSKIVKLLEDEYAKTELRKIRLKDLQEKTSNKLGRSLDSWESIYR